LELDAAGQQAFRTLHLQLLHGEGSGRTIMLTSASSGDGSTTCAVFLATSIALSGKRVILMDCDLRSPTAARLLGVDTESALAATGDPDAALDAMLKPVPGAPLSVLSLGPAAGSPGDLEPVVHRLPALLHAASLRADVVVIDTAPLGEVSDALPLLPEVDDVIVVTRPGRTDRRAYEVMRDLIQRMTPSVGGMVVVGTASGYSDRAVRALARGQSRPAPTEGPL